ncbi:hypothetical protein CEUSTIGMA_g8051.t1 [Chlamydomonas eustigma]|uniref:Uncharacterized protein n=1 Tax=Chlamydomonas eustigma TaxID=1157962 RepID=A0A250XC38_9CHLO|nr:hypothetical protein CEUSTIGMA_g8051.t1 [Chlamydomonas eustigma]|eukprot:GAX80616.1 hypothetical protein CEUSTIGMA_g8051.t1 [Chlamydomonas eustigma]
MATLTHEQRLKQLKDETESRRKKFEERELLLKQQAEQQAKEALQRRRHERLQEDQRMRKPWQEPPPPKKDILRAKQKQKPVTVVPKSPSSEVAQKMDHRREWREGLRAHIEQQRAVSQVQSPGGAALTWQELRLAAEAGFDELLRQQQEDRALGLDAGVGVPDQVYAGAGGGRHKSPYRSPMVMQRVMAAAGGEAVQVTLLPSAQPPVPPTASQQHQQQVLMPPRALATDATLVHLSYSKFSDQGPLITPSGVNKDSLPSGVNKDSLPSEASPTGPPQRHTVGTSGQLAQAALPRAEIASMFPSSLKASEHSGSRSVGSRDTAPPAADPDESNTIGLLGNSNTIGVLGNSNTEGDSPSLRRGVTSAARYRVGPQNLGDSLSSGVTAAQGEVIQLHLVNASRLAAPSATTSSSQPLPASLSLQKPLPEAASELAASSQSRHADVGEAAHPFLIHLLPGSEVLAPFLPPPSQPQPSVPLAPLATAPESRKLTSVQASEATRHSDTPLVDNADHSLITSGKFTPLSSLCTASVGSTSASLMNSSLQLHIQQAEAARDLGLHSGSMLHPEASYASGGGPVGDSAASFDFDLARKGGGHERPSSSRPRSAARRLSSGNGSRPNSGSSRAAQVSVTDSPARMPSPPSVPLHAVQPPPPHASSASNSIPPFLTQSSKPQVAVESFPQSSPVSETVLNAISSKPAQEVGTSSHHVTLQYPIAVKASSLTMEETLFDAPAHAHPPEVEDKSEALRGTAQTKEHQPSTSCVAEVVAEDGISRVQCAVDPNMGDLFAEIQQLSALRRALKAEFEAIGRGDAVAEMGTLGACGVVGEHGESQLEGEVFAEAWGQTMEEAMTEGRGSVDWKEEEEEEEEVEGRNEVRGLSAVEAEVRGLPDEEVVESEAASSHALLNTDRAVSAALDQDDIYYPAAAAAGPGNGPAKAPLLQWGPPGMLKRHQDPKAMVAPNHMARLDAPPPVSSSSPVGGYAAHVQIQTTADTLPLAATVIPVGCPAAQTADLNPALHTAPLQQAQNAAVLPDSQQQTVQVAPSAPQYISGDNLRTGAYQNVATTSHTAVVSSLPLQTLPASAAPAAPAAPAASSSVQVAGNEQQWQPPKAAEQALARQAVEEAIQQLHQTPHRLQPVAPQFIPPFIPSHVVPASVVHSPAPATAPAPATVPAPAPAPATAPLQWTIPVERQQGSTSSPGAAAAWPSPTRQQRAPSVGYTSVPGQDTMHQQQLLQQHQQQQQQEYQRSPARPSAPSPQRSPARPNAPSPQRGRLNAPEASTAAAVAAERPLVYDGSYAQAAAVARQRAEKELQYRIERESKEKAEREQRERDRSERERRERERLQREADMAALKAAYEQSGSDRSTSVGRGEVSRQCPLASIQRQLSFPSTQSSAVPDVGLQPPQQQQQRGPPLKAPANIGSYANPPMKPPLHSAARNGKPGAGTAGSSAPTSAPASTAQTPASLRGAPLSAPVTPGSLADPSPASDHTPSQQVAWGTPNSTSRIPTLSSRIPSPAPSHRHSERQHQQQQHLVPRNGTKSPDLDFDFLERASCSSEDGASCPTADQMAQIQIGNFNGSNKLNDSRPRALQIPGSGSSTPAAVQVRHQQVQGLPVVAAAAAAAAVPSRGASSVTTKAGSAPSGRSSRAASPFTQAVRELMGLPGALPLEHSKRASVASQRASSRLSAEEEKLLQSLQKLDGDILKRVAAGLEARRGGAAADHAAAAAAAGQRTKPAGKGGRGVQGKALTNSVQQEQLRESIEKLDLQLGALQHRMKERAVFMGVEDIEEVVTRGSPRAVQQKQQATAAEKRHSAAAAAAAAAAAGNKPLAKSKTPTPNKAKAIRDQKQAQAVARVAGGAAPGVPHQVRSAPNAAAAAAVPGLAHASGSHGMSPQRAAVSSGASVSSTSAQPTFNPSAIMPPPAVATASSATMQPFGSFFQGTQHQNPYMLPPFAHAHSGGLIGQATPSSLPMAPHPQQQQQQQQVVYVPTMMANGQVAYIPQVLNRQPDLHSGAFAQHNDVQSSHTTGFGQENSGMNLQAFHRAQGGVMQASQPVLQNNPNYQYPGSFQVVQPPHNQAAGMPQPGISTMHLYSFNHERLTAGQTAQQQPAMPNFPQLQQQQQHPYQPSHFTPQQQQQQQYPSMLPQFQSQGQQYSPSMMRARLGSGDGVSVPRASQLFEAQESLGAHRALQLGKEGNAGQKNTHQGSGQSAFIPETKDGVIKAFNLDILLGPA